MSETLVVNICGAPGVGKSSVASGVFSQLKLEQFKAELVTEYAKDLTWRGHHATLANQVYVTAKQYERLYAMQNKVDIVVTDSPILLGLLYPGKKVLRYFEPLVLELFSGFNNLNILLKRNLAYHPYVTEGRGQSQEEAVHLDSVLKKLLDKNSIPYIIAEMNGPETIASITALVRQKLLSEETVQGDTL